MNGLCGYARLLLAWMLLAPPAFTSAAELQPRIALTAAEIAWVQSNPVVRVGVSTEFPPYYFSDKQGRYEGFVIDLMDRLSPRLGLRFEYRRFPGIGEVLAAMKAGEIEVTPFLSETSSRREYLRFVRPLFSTQMVYVADRRRGDVTADERFAGYRVAVERQSPAAELLRERFPKAKLLEFDSPENAVLAVAGGDADVFVGFRQVAVYYMEKHFTANLALRGTIAVPGTALGPAVRSDLSLLAGLLDRAVADLSTEEITGLALKWLPRTVLGIDTTKRIELTPAQKEWIQAHRGLRLGFDANFAPITFANTSGGFDGLAADFTRLLARKAGMIIAYEQGGSFAEVYDRALQGDIDVIVAAGRNEQRRVHFEFVGPFLRVPSVIVAATDRAFDGDLGAVNALRVAILRNHFLIPQLRSRFPGLAIEEFPTQSEALFAVRNAQADVAIGNMKVVNALLEAQHEGALRTVGVVPEGDSELYFAVRNTTGELASVLRSAMNAISGEEFAALEERWLQPQVNVGVPWVRVLIWGSAIVSASALIIGLLGFSNRRLRLARTTLEQSQAIVGDENAARSRFTAYLSHELRGCLGGIVAGLRMLQEGTQVSGKLIPAMDESASGLLALCERTLDFERSLRGGVDLKPEPVRVVDTLREALAPWRLQAHVRGLSFDDDLTIDPAVCAEMDPVRFSQIIQNVVGNAIKFTAQGGVSVQAHLEPEGPMVSWLDILVVDTGPGIPSEERRLVFQPFSQGAEGKRTRAGAGLGLSIVMQIVAAMRGMIRIEDSSAPGSTFHIRLPLTLLAPGA
ncbi:MAG TPA: transporter substrate-binding domain-containing protein [Burkholderiaceae bacterium]